MAGSRVLALVVAHPDDDAYGLAGTVALHEHDPGFRFVFVNEPLGQIRRRGNVRRLDGARQAAGPP